MAARMDVPPSKKTMMILESLLNKSKFKNGLLEKFWERHSVEQVTGEDDLVLVQRHLDKERGEKPLNKTISRG